MSRAFVKEGDGEVTLPERAVSAHPNLVTASGLQHIEAEVRALDAARSAAREAARSTTGGAHDAQSLASIERDLRYWVKRRASARLIVPAARPQAVRFGVTVTLRAVSGEADAGPEPGVGDAIRVLRIVGEDEADPAHGLVSWVSPVAEGLVGARGGDEVAVGGQRYVIEKLEP